MISKEFAPKLALASSRKLATEEQKAAKKVAEMILIKRSLARWTQTELADIVNSCKPYAQMTQQRISQIEYGACPSCLELAAIASAFGCLITDFEV